MLSTLVLDAPAGLGGSGTVRASAGGCAAVPAAGLVRRPQLQGSGLPGGALLGADRKATGGALPTGVAVPLTALGTAGTAPVAHRRRTTVPAAVQSFATPITPYSTLGNHSPGRPTS